jgi:RimJ/RimL family protein N-acetyltransferase
MLVAVKIQLRDIPREAADSILAGERPDGHFPDDFPTEFSTGVESGVGAEGHLGPFFICRTEDDLVVGEIGGAFVDENGTIEIGYAIVESQWNRGHASAAIEALVAATREDDSVRRIVAHTPHDRPASGRVLEKAGFENVGEVDDTDETGNVQRVTEWKLSVSPADQPAEGHDGDSI